MRWVPLKKIADSGIPKHPKQNRRQIRQTEALRESPPSREALKGSVVISTPSEISQNPRCGRLRPLTCEDLPWRFHFCWTAKTFSEAAKVLKVFASLLWFLLFWLLPSCRSAHLDLKLIGPQLSHLRHVALLVPRLEQGLGAQGLAEALRCCAKANVWRRPFDVSTAVDLSADMV